MNIEKEIWGKSNQGEELLLYTLTNAKGASVQLTNIGASVVSIAVPDRDGELADVILGYPGANDYFHEGPFHGKTVGRYGNRIAKGKFELEGKTYTLVVNNGPNHLHGGKTGFDSRVWDSKIDGEALVFTHVSPDGDEGYPGTLTLSTRYTWSDNCELTIEYLATTDAPTVLNITNHSYFNLAGENSGSVLKHELKLAADKFLDGDENLIPTQPADVTGTPMDFRVAKALGQDIDADYTPLKYGAGYDHCFVVNGWVKGELKQVATLRDPESGRALTVSSTQPGVQIYTGNWLAGAAKGKSGRAYDNRDGVAIECQGFPDAPNRPDFPSQRLDPGQKFEEKIIFAFGVEL